MSEQAAHYQEIAEGIASPVERAAFRFFYEATVKEGVDTHAGYTWDQFEDGVAPFNGLPIEMADQIVENSGLVPNYTPESTERNGLKDTVPLTEALEGPFVKSLHRSRQEGAVRVMGIHPSMATPFVIARSLAAAYETEYQEDIRPNIHIVVGAYPTVLNYDIRLKSGDVMSVSPVDFGRFLGNLVLTAPKTVSTETDEAAVQEWMNAVRSEFRVRNREIMSEAGKILIVHPAGRRGRRSHAKVPPFYHIEYLPDSSLKYITELPVPTYVVGVDDNLLNSANDPSSVVHVLGDPRPYYLQKENHVTEALKRSAFLASHGDTVYRVEGWRDRALRLGQRVVGRRPAPSVE